MIGIGINNIFFKRFSRIYGPELVTEGDFGNGGAAWGVSGESTVNTGVGRCYSSAGAFSLFKQDGVLEVGKSYRLEYDVISTNGVNLSSNTGTPINTWSTSTTGHKVKTFTAGETGLFFKRISGVADVSIDNISVKEIL